MDTLKTPRAMAHALTFPCRSATSMHDEHCDNVTAAIAEARAEGAIVVLTMLAAAGIAAPDGTDELLAVVCGVLGVEHAVFSRKGIEMLGGLKL